MKQVTKEQLKEQVLKLIPDTRSNAITSRELMSFTGLKFRELKEIITELRLLHPICSKETGGGGYWIAEDEKDIKEFIAMIGRRRDGYNKTITIMENHICDEVN
jgi:hypothetical protein